MRAGDLRHRIRVQEKRETKNSVGETVTEWKDVICCRASIMPISGRENFSSEQFGSETTTKITVRWSKKHDSVTPKHRIVAGDRIYNIEGIVPDATGRINVRYLCSRAYDDRYQG